MVLRILSCLFLLLSYLKSDAQFIVAGSFGPDDYYQDIDPDSALDALVVNHTNHPGETMDLDVDSDGISDIRIKTWANGGLGGGSGACCVFPLHPAVGIVAAMDTFQVCCPSDYRAIVADTLHAGDTISTANPYHDTVTTTNDPWVYVWSKSYGGAGAPIIQVWNDIGEHFIGFRLQYSFDTLYGWIRVDVTYPGLFVITIKDFACNRNTHIGIEEAPTTESVVSFPNPVRDKLTISTSFEGHAEVRLYSVLSSLVRKVEFQNRITLDVSDLEEGFYYFQLLSGEKVIGKGRFLRE